MDVSVLIVSYNTKMLLKQCLKSIIEHTQDIDYEIIVVDNASSDGSVKMIKEIFPMVRIIENTENIGFGRASNLGANHATGNYLLFLNSDTYFTCNVLKEYLQFYEVHTQLNIGAIGGILLDERGKDNASCDRFPSAYNDFYFLIDFILRKMKLTKGFMARKHNKVRKLGFDYVDYIIGADLFIAKNIFESLGGFDPVFFLYFEETDLQKRMEKKGIVRILINCTGIVHLEGGSFSQENKLPYKRYIFALESLYTYTKRYFKGFGYISFRFSRLIISILLSFKYKFSSKEKIQMIKQILLIK